MPSPEIEDVLSVPNFEMGLRAISVVKHQAGNGCAEGIAEARVGMKDMHALRGAVNGNSIDLFRQNVTSFDPALPLQLD